MWKPRAFPHALALSLLLLHGVLALVSAQGSNKTAWNTLSGHPPLVIARGGFSGIFPDSSSYAYILAGQVSMEGSHAWCDVQLTKDGAGICVPDIKLDNGTDIFKYYQNRSTNYLVNGVPTRGYFSVDYTLKELSIVNLVQGVFSRSDNFDGNHFPILTVELLVKDITPPGLWLNIQHDAFYAEHKLSMRNFVLSLSKRVIANYISSPEAGFLRSISARLSPRTKLVFRFLDEDKVDPSTNQTYGSLLKNLTFIKTFASGILVPKRYIWPVDASLSLQPHTSLVSDAHKVGLEVFASDFVNDIPFSFNYSYDPVAEHLQFIDNGEFSVDGVLSDFPITPSEAIGCFAHVGANAPKRVNTLVISKYGASGDYPACTDLAYQKAISDGVDVIDCPVQMSRDGIPFCLSSADLTDSTNVAQTSFNKHATSIPEIKSSTGIYTFHLTWSDIIQHLTPLISSPQSRYKLFRNPKNNKKGKFLTLSKFLNVMKSQASLPGVMIIVENAAYLAEKQGFSVTDTIIDTLSKAGYDKPGAPKVMIQSADSSVLKKFKEKTGYELVYKIDEDIGDAVDSAVQDIRSFAHSVVVDKSSVFPVSSAFLTYSSKTVPKFKSANLSVYVETFSNEFVSQAWDFFSDATVEINTFVEEGGIDGVITDFPKTANRYRRNSCLNSGNVTPPYMRAVEVGGLLQAVAKPDLPPALAPFPPLTESDVTEPPLPSASSKTAAPSSSPGPRPGPPSRNGQAKVTISFFFSSLVVLVASLMI